MAKEQSQKQPDQQVKIDREELMPRARLSPLASGRGTEGRADEYWHRARELMEDEKLTATPQRNRYMSTVVMVAAIGIGARGWPTSITDRFWQYAKQAMLAACSAETDEDTRGLFALAGTWAQAAASASCPDTNP